MFFRVKASLGCTNFRRGKRPKNRLSLQYEMGRFDPALPISKEKETKMCINAWPSSFLEKRNDDGLVQLLQKTF